MNTGMSARVLNLESNAVSKIQVTELEHDIENLKLWRAYLTGAWALSTITLIPLAYAYFTKGF